MVFYRKYRPQTINELDSKEVREKLYSVLSGKSVPHAFLFTGPKGLGKTSTARIIAKIVNCEKKRKVIEPCNKCNQCISINNGNNLDILEIDGASNRGIDEIRDLREKVKLSPFRADKKVYIIDEVHMLTTEAFNALLKTLEEPPAHVIFILCTTEPHKVPATIASRCFHIAFRRAKGDELVRSFKRIVKKEGIKIDDEALNLIANFAEGSFRDGVKILEEIAMASSRKKITKELVEEKYQISNSQYQIAQMVEFLAKRDTKASLNLVRELVEQGINLKFFIEQLINDFHSLLLAYLGVEQKTEAGGRKVELSAGEIKKIIELLAGAYGELKYAVLPQLPLELAIIEWGMKDIENYVLAGPATSQPQAFPTALTSAGPPLGAPRSVSPATKSNDIWQKLIEKIKPYNHSVAGVLRGCKLKSFSAKKIVIEAKFRFHKERLEERKIRELIEKVFGEIVGKKVKVAIILKPA